MRMILVKSYDIRKRICVMAGVVYFILSGCPAGIIRTVGAFFTYKLICR
jgi:hypothetical protein